MKILHKWIILAGLLITALICYGYGVSHQAVAFIVLGVVVELAFWCGVFGKKCPRNEGSLH